LNDTIELELNINPKLSVTVNPLSDANSCFKIGSGVHQEVMIVNTGNVDIEEVEVVVFVDATSLETVRETLPLPLQAGDTVFHIFNNTYTAPFDPFYQVIVTAFMKCDSAKVNARNAANECADIHDVLIESLLNPSGQEDIAGSTENIVVLIKNRSDNKRFLNVPIVALVEDENGEVVSSRAVTIPIIEAADTNLQFTFTESYTVPNGTYFIRVYLNSIDNYPENDTLYVSRTTTVRISPIGETNLFTLGQNIPNPANSSTRINYSLPEAGAVVFHVHSISGQLLYSKTIEASRGTQSIELNTSTLAAGIYFYSIEYKGQRLVKRMSVQK
jgi:hypothetical protein